MAIRNQRSETMTPEAFATLGLQGVAYVRRVLETPPGSEAPQIVFAIHAANGERIGMAPARDLAFAAIRQNDLEPLDAH